MRSLETQAEACVEKMNQVAEFLIGQDGGGTALEYLLQSSNASCLKEILLLLAVRTKDSNKVDALLLSGKLFSEKMLRQCLSEAIHLECASVVDSLLKNAIDSPNFYIEEDTRTTPLHMASSEVELVKVLLKHGADPNATDCEGHSPLHLVASNHLCARSLIAHGADPNLRDNLGNTSLHIACHGGHFETLKELHFANPDMMDEYEQTPLHEAARGGYIEIIRWLIQVAKADPTPATNVPPLEYAACYGRIMPKELIDLGFDPRQLCPESGTIAHSILRFDNDELDEDNFRLRFMDELLQCDRSLVGSLDRFQNTPLHWAQSPDMVKLLVEKFGADLIRHNRGGRIPLVESIFMENSEDTVECFLRLMTERDLDIDQTDKIGWTALHHATFHGKSEIVKLLLKFGADKDKPNDHGRTPLHLVGYPFLAGRRMDSFRDDDITRAMRLPSRKKLDGDDESSYTKAVDSLLSSGANAVHQDAERNLPFFLAAVMSRSSETFLMVKQAAAQGLFDLQNKN